METLRSEALKISQAGKALLGLALYPKEIFETALHEGTFVKSDEECTAYISLHEDKISFKYNRGRSRFFRLVGDRLYYWARNEDAQLSRRAAAGIRSKLLAKRPHSGGHSPGKKLNNVGEDLRKTSGRPPTFSAAFWKNPEKFGQHLANSAKLWQNLRNFCKKSAKNQQF